MIIPAWRLISCSVWCFGLHRLLFGVTDVKSLLICLYFHREKKKKKKMHLQNRSYLEDPGEHSSFY